MVKTLPISKVKERLTELVASIQDHEEEVVVICNGKPAAVLMSYVKFKRLKGTLGVLSDRNLMRQVDKSLKFYGSGRSGLSFEDVFGEPLVPSSSRASAKG